METIKGYTKWCPNGSESLSEILLPSSTKLNSVIDTKNHTREESSPSVKRLQQPAKEKTQNSGDDWNTLKLVDMKSMTNIFTYVYLILVILLALHCLDYILRVLWLGVFPSTKCMTAPFVTALVSHSASERGMHRLNVRKDAKYARNLSWRKY